MITLAACRPVLEGLIAKAIDDRLVLLNRFGEDPDKPSYASASFANWESPHVAPLALTPDGNRLLAVNAPAASTAIPLGSVLSNGSVAWPALSTRQTP